METVGFAGKCKGMGILTFARCFSFSKAQHTLAAIADSVHIPSPAVSLNSSPDEQGYADTPEWKMFKSKDLGLSTSMINKPALTVLKGLQKTGYEAYLVGGCVRDLVLKRTPKDFDVLTTADLQEIRRNFSRCNIIGRRFPICHVHVRETIVEVSSFKTSERKGKNDFVEKKQKPTSCNDRDYARWRNCMRRDFTINGLMYDPYENVVYDYIGGLEDLKAGKVRTVIPAHSSFAEDCARILRGIRIAARLNFKFSRDTACAIKDHSHYILRLDKGRIMMEMNYMLAFGTGEASLRLLWRFGLLEILLPMQAAYLVSQGFRRRDKRSNMLLVLFTKLDELLAPDRPCHCSLWVSLLAFHLALAGEPQDALVITAFALSVRNGGNLKKAMDKSRKIYKKSKSFSPEVLDVVESESNEKVMNKILDLAGEVKSTLSAMTDADAVSQAMSKYYPQAPFSDLVFITIPTFSRVRSIFACVGGHREERVRSKEDVEINYRSLVDGELKELRFVFAKIVIDSLYVTHFDKKSDTDPS
ncbi:uncharacterized protein LOC131077029 isoform X1 [Cryptomeria japonica]|uniref:uncharacterized protein LOC131077029 isoform X1 n=1 Tax=Cryptomeria japonica TaxID=3369 RepID=UPI0027D9EEA6|nr:uncharacterized protein LOC131077029 isoform X1 [Cryptomeria japonica]